MQEGLTSELRQQIKCLPGSLHSTSNLLMPQQADAAVHSGLCQLYAASSIQVPQFCMCLHQQTGQVQMWLHQWLISTWAGLLEHLLCYGRVQSLSTGYSLVVLMIYKEFQAGAGHSSK